MTVPFETVSKTRWTAFALFERPVPPLHHEKKRNVAAQPPTKFSHKSRTRDITRLHTPIFCFHARCRSSLQDCTCRKHQFQRRWVGPQHAAWPTTRVHGTGTLPQGGGKRRRGLGYRHRKYTPTMRVTAPPPPLYFLDVFPHVPPPFVRVGWREKIQF